MSVLASLSTQDIAAKAISLLDLTSLNDTDTEADITRLCQQARQGEHQVAALCIYPRFIPWAKAELARLGIDGVKIATVSNFPHGRADIDAAVAETKACVAYGADEVDVVFPWRSLLEGNEEVGYQLVAACKAACGQSVRLKVILETGELKSAELIAKASQIAIRAGADFIKTSTGKVPVNATPEAATIMLQQIHNTDHMLGFKPAGGVKTLDDAKVYLQLAEQYLGADNVTAQWFRFGTSSLLPALLAVIGYSTEGVSQGDY